MPEVDLPPSDTRGDRSDFADAPGSYSYFQPPGNALISPLVHLVFWGSSWNGAPKLSPGVASEAVRSLLEDTIYLSGLDQYGVTGANYDGYSILSAADPPVNFNDQNVQDLLVNALNAQQIPGLYSFSDYIYAVVTPLGARGARLAALPIREPGPDGKNLVKNVITRATLADGVEEDTFGKLYFFWVDQDGTLDWFTHVFSHELVELLADAGAKFGNQQIGDPCNQTGARLRNGIFVTGYYSQADATCIAPGQPGTEHSGPFIQSRYGTAGDFVLMVATPFSLNRPSGIECQQLSNDPGGKQTATRLPALTDGTALACTAIQSNYGQPVVAASAFNYGLPGNLEVVARIGQGPDLGDHLVSYWRASRSLTWHGPEPITVDGAPLDNVTSNPAMVQSSFGIRGNFELLVVRGEDLHHYWRDNDALAPVWHDAGVVYVGEPVNNGRELFFPAQVVSVALIRSNYGPNGSLEIVTRMKPRELLPGIESDYLAHAWFNGHHWSSLHTILVDEQPIQGVTGNPAFIQGTFGRPGNFELIVPQGDRLRHFWRDNSNRELPWHSAPDPIAEPSNVIAVSLLQSDLRQGGITSPGPGNLAAIIRRQTEDPTDLGDDQMRLVTRSSTTMNWTETSIPVEGAPLN